MKQHNDFHYHRLGYCPWKDAFLFNPEFQTFYDGFRLGSDRNTLFGAYKFK